MIGLLAVNRLMHVTKSFPLLRGQTAVFVLDFPQGQTVWMVFFEEFLDQRQTQPDRVYVPSGDLHDGRVPPMRSAHTFALHCTKYDAFQMVIMHKPIPKC